MSAYVMIDLTPDSLDAKATVKAVVFAIASRRTLGTRLLKVAYTEDKNTRVLLFRKLRKLRAAGRIVCFAQAGDAAKQEAEALYILDKIPEVAEDPDFLRDLPTVSYILLS